MVALTKGREKLIPVGRVPAAISSGTSVFPGEIGEVTISNGALTLGPMLCWTLHGDKIKAVILLLGSLMSC